MSFWPVLPTEKTPEAPFPWVAMGLVADHPGPGAGKAFGRLGLGLRLAHRAAAGAAGRMSSGARARLLRCQWVANAATRQLVYPNVRA
jgi:hypothetical protein